MAKQIDEARMKEELDEEMSRFQDDGYFKRLGKMFAGFSKPRDSREYKAALIELQRQSAPLTAVLIPLIAITVLAVVSAVGSKPVEEIKVDIVQADKEETKLDDIEPEKEITPPPDVDVEVPVDTPVIGDPREIATAVGTVSTQPVSPKVNSVDAMMNINSPVTMKSVYGARATGIKGVLSKGGAGYGDASTEAAVLKALRWLKHTQLADGSWQAAEGYKSATACTGFAVLSYLAHNETPGSKEFGDTVQKALNYLIYAVKDTKDGSVRMDGCDQHEYAFCIGAYALAEAYGMTRNPNCKDAAEKCVKRIVDNQTPTGGWNYNLAKTTREAPDDMSYGGWAIQALKAAKMAGIHVDGQDECIKKAISCLKTRNFDKEWGFLYRPGNRSTSHGLGGVGCLAMQLLGYGREPEVRTALDVMRGWEPSFDKKDPSAPKSAWNAPQYYFYYASQCKYQAGMSKGATPADAQTWKKWNLAMKALYPKTIITLPETILGPDGKQHKMGYWRNTDNYSARPVMDTCLCALQLMVYYRYLPTTSLKATEVEADVDAASKDKEGEVGVHVDI